MEKSTALHRSLRGARSRARHRPHIGGSARQTQRPGAEASVGTLWCGEVLGVRVDDPESSTPGGPGHGGAPAPHTHLCEFYLQELYQTQ